MKTNKIKVLTVATLFGCCFVVNAQEDNKLSREMTLEREYDPTVQDASKVNRLPEVKEPVVTKRPIDYSPFTIATDPKKEITLLPSGDIMTAIPYNTRRGYFHFGGGMYANLNGDLGYHLLDSQRDKLSLFVTHHSTNGSVKFTGEEGEDDRKTKAKLNDNLVGLAYQHAFEQHATLHLGATYNYTGFNYYGLPLYFSPSSVWTPTNGLDTATNQVNQAFRAHIGVEGLHNESFGYLLDVAFLHFNQKYGWTKDADGIRENLITLNLDLNKHFGNGNQRAGLAGKLDFFNYSYPSLYNNNDTTGYQGHSEITLTPYYRIEGDNWHLKLGANVMFVTGDSLTISASPNISVEAKIADKTVFYADASGEIGSNDAYGLSRQNRYMDHSTAVKPSRTWLDATLGIRSAIAPGCRIDVFGGYKATKDDIFFIPGVYGDAPMDFASYSSVLQTDASLFRVGASLKYVYLKWVDFSLKGVYNQWNVTYDGRGITHVSTDKMDMKPYGRPAFELNADLTVKPLTPLALSLNYYLGASRYTLVSQEEKEMNNINDLNFTGTWNFNDTFGAYVKLNNLFFQQQELLYGYPLQGFNAMVGVNINF